jgi:hypothetical protein
VMRQLLAWDVDGIMTAEPIRLERVLCKLDAPRPTRPPGAPGHHCSRRASIACDVEVARALLRGDRAVVTLRRQDRFDGRCAGRLVLRAGGRAAERFAFGAQPSPNGPRSRKVDLDLGERLRERLAGGAQAKLTARPFHAFARTERLRLR